MKPISIVVSFLLFLPAICAADVYVIGLPSGGGQPSSIYEDIESFVVHEMELGDTLHLIDAYTLSSIARIRIPADSKAYKYAKFRKKKFRVALKKLRENIGQSSDGLGGLINLPNFLDHLADNILGGASGQAVNVLVVGSALHREEREPLYTMHNGLFPSDGHIQVSEEHSVYGVKNKREQLRGLRLHFLYTDEPNAFSNSLYRYRIERFWHLFVKYQGGEFITFTSDADTAFERFGNMDAKSVRAYSFDHTANKVEMLRARRDAGAIQHSDVNGTRFMHPDASISTFPPSVAIGKLKIGIRWDCLPCDIDIYARGGGDRPFLYYNHRESVEGEYFKDFRSSPDTTNGLEYIEFNNPVNLYELQVLVNHYAGEDASGPKGVVRIWFNGKTYEIPFHLNSTKGNLGQDVQHASTSPNWRVFDVAEILGLAADRQATVNQLP